jgi:hypothetical protein
LIPAANRFADGRRRVHIATILNVALQVLIDGASGSQSAAGAVVNDLGVNVLVAAEDRQPRPFAGSPDALPHPISTPQPLM